MIVYYQQFSNSHFQGMLAERFSPDQNGNIPPKIFKYYASNVEISDTMATSQTNTPSYNKRKKLLKA